MLFYRAKVACGLRFIVKAEWQEADGHKKRGGSGTNRIKCATVGL